MADKHGSPRSRRATGRSAWGRARCIAPPGGKQRASLVEVSEYEPDRTFALRVIEGALPIDAGLTFEPAERGTVVRLTAHGQLTGAMPLAQPLLRRTLKRQFTGHCATIKRVLENNRALSPANRRA